MMSLNRSSWCFGWRQKTWVYLKALQKSDEHVETNHTSTFHRSRACSLFGPASKMLIFWDALPPPPNWSLSFPERQNVFLRVAMGHECKHCFSSARTTQCDTIHISFKNFLKVNCHLVLAFGACHQCFGLDFTACSQVFTMFPQISDQF